MGSDGCGGKLAAWPVDAVDEDVASVKHDILVVEGEKARRGTSLRGGLGDKDSMNLDRLLELDRSSGSLPATWDLTTLTQDADACFEEHGRGSKVPGSRDKKRLEDCVCRSGVVSERVRWETEASLDFPSDEVIKLVGDGKDLQSSLVTWARISSILGDKPSSSSPR